MSNVEAKLAALEWPKVFGLSLLIAGLYFVSGMYDNGTNLETQIKNGQGKLVETKKRLSDTQTELANADEFRKKVIRLEEDFVRLTEALPKEISKTDMLGIISRTANEARVVVVNSAPYGQDVKEDIYEKTMVKFDLEGTFTDIVTFLSRLTGIRRLLTFDKIEIKRVGEGEKPKVQFSGLMVGYRYIPESERKKQTTPAK